jgi:hypothetical protein
MDEIELCYRYAPIIMFDAKEPFLPIRVGYTIFKEKVSTSPSFPREIVLNDNEKFSIEYAIYWDWDIGHLYELEHIWVYVDNDGKILRVEASWHGKYNLMENAKIKEDTHPVLYSQPGKHAFAPDPSWFEPKERFTLPCTQEAGIGGLLITRLFEGKMTKTLDDDELVLRYLSRFAFTPSFNFSKEFRFQPEDFQPWEEVEKWIPKRVREVLENIKKEVL